MPSHHTYTSDDRRLKVRECPFILCLLSYHCLHQSIQLVPSRAVKARWLCGHLIYVEIILSYPVPLWFSSFMKTISGLFQISNVDLVSVPAYMTFMETLSSPIWSAEDWQRQVCCSPGLKPTSRILCQLPGAPWMTLPETIKLPPIPVIHYSTRYMKDDCTYGFDYDGYSFLWNNNQGTAGWMLPRTYSNLN